MSKQSVSEQADSASAESHGWLRGLIDALHGLMIMVSSRLRHAQIQRSPMADAKGEYDIRKRLGSHLQQISAERKPGANSPPNGEGTATTDHDHHENTLTTARGFNHLSEHSERKAIDQLLPRMNEQLQRTTMDHINVSLILAREGNANGAELHIDLAQNAMRTASRFMSHEEYEIFEQKVEHRLESIIGGNRPDDSGR